MVTKTEVICTLPFKAKTSASYGFLVTPTLVVVEDGRRVYDTNRAGDADASYSVKGNQLIRTFDPSADKRAATLKAKRDAALGSKSFRALVAAFGKKLRAKGERFGDDGPVSGFAFPARRLVDEDAVEEDDVDAVLALQREAKATGAFAFLTRFAGDLDSWLAVVPDPDPCAALGLVEAGGADVDVEKALRSLDKSAGLTMTRIQFDTVRGTLARVPKDLDAQARALARLGIESATVAGLKKELARRRIFLWWD